MDTLPSSSLASSLNRDFDPLFSLGHNCAAIGKVERGTVLVDCAAYYRALHESISRARHSIFILGWDIDSRIQLLRGKEAEEATAPIRLLDLIDWKARANPKLQIYLNRWNYSSYLLLERELFASAKWRARCPDNVHFLMDKTAPLGASHHQKVVVIDDEVAFCGGMDVSRCRWDHREHHPLEAERRDPTSNAGIGKDNFGPYHDTQMVVSGPIVTNFSDLVRERWHTATGHTLPPVPSRPAGPPQAWPECAKIHINEALAAISLTMPHRRRDNGLRQAEQMYFDLINTAENFIYMENQYVCYLPLASALNARLKAKPDLRVLTVSSYNPQGMLERKSMWKGRADFYDMAASGVDGRFLMAYPTSHEHGIIKDVRIHSKLMIVDDKYLRVGSTNINNRSMSLDSECDLILSASNEHERQQFAATRNDLIREHTGYEIEQIEAIVNNHGNIKQLITPLASSRQHLCQVDDAAYRHEKFSKLAIWLADRSSPLL